MEFITLRIMGGPKETRQGIEAEKTLINYFTITKTF